jgi:DNA-binding response OmpR family regulator
VAHILLIEDDDEVVAFTRTILAKHSYGLDVAQDGEAALAAYMTRRPDLILLDVFVPRLDGLRFAREIRSRFPSDNTPIVVWTGAYEPEKMGDLVDTPHVLPKPVSSEELLEVVRRALHAETPSKALRVLAVARGAAILRALVRELREEFDVNTADRWEEVLALLDIRAYEAVVVDLGSTPEDGAAVLRSAAARDKQVARIALLGPGQEALGKTLIDSGAAEAVLPPDRAPGALGARLHAILG